jgi:chromosome partitioning protein
MAKGTKRTNSPVETLGSKGTKGENGGKRMNARRIAVWNPKGGVGKTSVSVNLAAVLAETGLPVLLVDLDPQGNATQWCSAAREEAPGQGLLTALLEGGTLASIARPTSVPGLDVVGSGAAMYHAERHLAIEPIAPDTRLRGLFETAGTRWKVILVDCPPQMGRLVTNALSACGEVLVPIADAMSLAGLSTLVQTVAAVQRHVNAELRIGGFVLTRERERLRVAREIRQALAERFQDLLVEASIHDCVAVMEAPSHGQPVTSYAPRSRAAGDYRALAAEVFGREVALG